MSGETHDSEIANDPASIAKRAEILAVLQGKVRLGAVFLALATGFFAWAARDAGQPR